jgi:hypothetical protein
VFRGCGSDCKYTADCVYVYVGVLLMGTFAVYSSSEGIVTKALAKAGIVADVVGRAGDATTLGVSAGDHARAMAVIEQIRTNNAKSFPVLWTMAGIVGVLGVAAVVAPVALAAAGPYIMIGLVVLGGLRMLVYNFEWSRSFKLGGAPGLGKAALVVGIITLIGFLLFAYALGMVLLEEGVI